MLVLTNFGEVLFVLFKLTLVRFCFVLLKLTLVRFLFVL